jgi:VWFA-related protein
VTIPAILFAVAVSAGTQAVPPVFPAAVELVRVEVRVTRGGRPVVGLVTSDFELRDNGVLQAIDLVAGPTPHHRSTSPDATGAPGIAPFEAGAAAPTGIGLVQGLDATLVLDMSGSVAGRRLQALREAATAFLDGLDPRDRAALVTFTHQTTLREALTPDLGRIRAAILAARCSGGTALRDALYVALHLSEPGPRRSAAVVFSDGIDNLSWLRAGDVVEAARRSATVVYAVVVRDPDDPDHPFLDDVTHATGGRVWTIRRDRDLRAGFLEVLQDIRSRYLLSYAPSGVETAGWHALSVRLRGKKGEVLARPGYSRAIAPEP